MSLIEELLSDLPGGEKALRQQDLLVKVSESIWEQMEKMDMQLIDVAKTCGFSKSDLSQKLSGRRNLTLRTLSDIVDALDCVVKIEIEQKNKGWKTIEDGFHSQNKSKAIPQGPISILPERWSPLRSVS